MLQSMGLQRAEHDLVTEQQQHRLIGMQLSFHEFVWLIQNKDLGNFGSRSKGVRAPLLGALNGFK